MNTPQNPSASSHLAVAFVRDLDDITLRSGHALLNAQRAQDFAIWLDFQLNGLEKTFSEFATPRSMRRYLGR